MVNFSLTTTESYPKNTRFASAKRSKGVRGACLDFEMDITLTLDFTLNAQITVVLPFAVQSFFCISSCIEKGESVTVCRTDITFALLRALRKTRVAQKLLSYYFMYYEKTFTVNP